MIATEVGEATQVYRVAGPGSFVQPLAAARTNPSQLHLRLIRLRHPVKAPRETLQNAPSTPQVRQNQIY